MTLGDRIKEKATTIGFDQTGIVRAEPLSFERDRLRDWLDLGYHGEMAWMERVPDKRGDPRQLMPTARSMIVSTLNYYTPHSHQNAPSEGKLSRYAWGDDYHDVLRGKLAILLEWIKGENPAAEGKICVDTAPLMDKAWAVRSGLGWLGKHSNLITKKRGSWVFIGSILLDVELDYDTEIIEDHCGTCTMCLDACPTSAIVQPYVVDARKCISYATIELRDEKLPDEIEANLNGWIYGCDICQDVCPWNRFETPTLDQRFEPRLGQTSLDLAETAAMNHPEYVERFRKSAVKRTKLAGLKRNAGALETSRSK